MPTNSVSDELYDLDKWNEYEEVNPSIFIGMHQFWFQKIL
jgi:hypothetical protein